MRRLLTFAYDNITSRFIRYFPKSKQYIVNVADRIVLNGYYYTGATWCVIAVRILLLPPLDPRRFNLQRIPRKAFYIQNVTHHALKRRIR